MLQMPKEIQEQRRVEQERIQRMDEQHRVDLIEMQRTVQELRAGRAPAMPPASTEHFPALKLDFKKLSRESEDWNTWSGVHQAQLSALGYAEDDIKIGSGDFDRNSVNSKQLRAAHQE